MNTSSSLCEAVRSGEIEAVSSAVEAGASLDELDGGNSPLHWAVFGGYFDIVALLLEGGANPNTFSDDGVTPCWRAADFGLSEIEALLRCFGGEIATNEAFSHVPFKPSRS